LFSILIFSRNFLNFDFCLQFSGFCGIRSDTQFYNSAPSDNDVDVATVISFKVDPIQATKVELRFPTSVPGQVADFKIFYQKSLYIWHGENTASWSAQGGNTPEIGRSDRDYSAMFDNEWATYWLGELSNFGLPTTRNYVTIEFNTQILFYYLQAES